MALPGKRLRTEYLLWVRAARAKERCEMPKCLRVILLPAKPPPDSAKPKARCISSNKTHWNWSNRGKMAETKSLPRVSSITFGPRLFPAKETQTEIPGYCLWWYWKNLSWDFCFPRSYLQSWGHLIGQNDRKAILDGRGCSAGNLWYAGEFHRNKNRSAVTFLKTFCLTRRRVGRRMESHFNVI